MGRPRLADDRGSSSVVTADQERFQSYNSTSERTITVSSAQSKTYVFQHEFNTLFTLSSDHLGNIFAPMPPATFTATVTTANGTTIDYTFDTQNEDDFLEPASGRVWVKNDTQTFGEVTWRDITILSSGETCSITSYTTCDAEVYAIHFELNNEHHFGIERMT